LLASVLDGIFVAFVMREMPFIVYSLFLWVSWLFLFLHAFPFQLDPFFCQLTGMSFDFLVMLISLLNC
jgi:hypothetical protein